MKEVDLNLDYIKYITILHPLDRIEEYRWLSAFFRLVGILVCERISDTEFDSAYEEKTDLIIIIEESKEYSWKSIKFINKGEEGVISIDCSNKLVDYNERNWIQVLLENIGDSFSAPVFNELQLIARCYVEEDLMRRIYSMEYFSDVSSYGFFAYIEESREHYYRAYNRLIEIEENASKYTLAAICNCQRRLNELQTIIWLSLKKQSLVEHHQEFMTHLKTYPYQSYEIISKRIDRILSLDEEFYIAFAIRGFAKLTDEKFILESVYDFERAVSGIGENPYSSCLLYRIGKYFEDVRVDKKMASAFFKRAYATDMQNYRAIYKIAMEERENGKWRMSLNYFQKILDILECKMKLPVLQPIECAYLYKTNMRMGEIYMKIREYKNALSKFQTAYEFGDMKFNQPFYEWMFGQDASYFKSEAVKKLRISQCVDFRNYAAAMNNISRKDLRI